MGQLSGKVAIVAGGGSGIGKGIAKAYANEGCAVVIAGRNADRLKATAEELGKSGSPVLAVPTDVGDEAQVKSLFKQTMDRFGRVDIVVNSSGAFDGGPLEDISLEAWNRVIAANLTGPFLCTREAFRVMKGQGGGRIINIGSISAQRTRQNMTAYTATKFGIDGLTHSIALEGREYGIAASCIHPGNTLVERRMGRRGSGDEGEEPMMPVEVIAQTALFCATLPPEATMFESIVMPIAQKYVGRG